MIIIVAVAKAVVSKVMPGNRGGAYLVKNTKPGSNTPTLAPRPFIELKASRYFLKLVSVGISLHLSSGTFDHRDYVADVVGPICESGDFLALDRQIDDAQPGDLLAVQSTGAYGFVMSSNYNSRPRAPEVLVDGDRFAVITKRESYDDLVRNEIKTPDWRSR